jgi:hypothetical protein
MNTKKTLLPILLNLAHRLRHARYDVFSYRLHENFQGLQYSEAVMREAAFSFAAAKQIANFQTPQNVRGSDEVHQLLHSTVFFGTDFVLELLKRFTFRIRIAHFEFRPKPPCDEQHHHFDAAVC